MEETKKPRIDNHQGNEIQDFPVELIHLIMHSLDGKNTTKLSILSKDFYSHWLSFPVLDFNYDFFRQMDNSDETFFNHVRSICQLRAPHINNTSPTLNFKYHEELRSIEPFNYRTEFDALLEYALRTNCEKIIFYVQISVPYSIFLLDRNVISKLVSFEKLVPLFNSKFLTVLKLSGLKFSPIADATITCPKLQELLINSCEGFNSINVLTPSIKKFEIKCCNGLRAFKVQRKMLESFKFEGIRNWNGILLPCDFDLPLCDSLRYLHLTKVEVLMAYYLNDLVVESLYLGQCDLPEDLKIYNSHIKVLEMENNLGVHNLVLNTPNLESFKFKATEGQQITLNILACLDLSALKVVGVSSINDEWLKSVMSSLIYLKEVELITCVMLEKMKLKSDMLEKLTVYGCVGINEIMVDACNLEEFNYSGDHFGIPILILSGKCSGNIKLSRNTTDQLLWFETLAHFLRSFDHFKDLTFSCISAQDMIFPREFVWMNRTPPLFDVKHVRFEGGEIPDNEVVAQLVESLMWFVPKPQTLALTSITSGKTRTLKFGHGRRVEARKVEECCSSLPFKCWKHFVLRVAYEGFDDDDDDEDMKSSLETFFAPYMLYPGEY